MFTVNFSRSIKFTLIFIFCSILSACSTLTPESAIYPPDRKSPAPITNFQVVIPGALYRGGQPEKNEEWDYLKNTLNIKTIIKLNAYPSSAELEEISFAEKFGIALMKKYMQPDDWPKNWNFWAAPEDIQIKDVLNILKDKSKWPIFIHCNHGKDRTGLLVALYRVQEMNYCIEKAAKEMDGYGASSMLLGIKPILEKQTQNKDCIN